MNQPEARNTKKSFSEVGYIPYSQYKNSGVFPKWMRNLVNSANSAQFKYHLCYLHLAGTVVASWSLT